MLSLLVQLLISAHLKAIIHNNLDNDLVPQDYRDNSAVSPSILTTATSSPSVTSTNSDEDIIENYYSFGFAMLTLLFIVIVLFAALIITCLKSNVSAEQSIEMQTIITKK
jgi:hypothetical protein